DWTRHGIAAAIYVVVIAACIFAIWQSISGLLERREIVQAAETMLAQIEGRVPGSARTAGSPLGAAPAGSPFLAGQTVTVAGAALLERVGRAVNKINGSVLSSQVDLQKADSKDGWISLIVSADIEPASLQPLLYDIESGMPFLFIDQLVVEAPIVGVEKSRMHVLMTVTGQWVGNK
ncbi:MAG: type II secretion system protein GspM, partial [Candidatus Binataceae bacterium]